MSRPPPSELIEQPYDRGQEQSEIAQRLREPAYWIQKLVRVDRGRDGESWMDAYQSPSEEISKEQCTAEEFNRGSQGPWRAIRRQAGQADIVIWPPELLAKLGL